MTFRAFQPNFSRGELSPDLYGRFDVDAWQSSVKTARNVLILKYGGLTKRPGTRLVAEVLDISQPNRIVPFQFSLTQTYALEFGQGYMSPCALGGRLVETELVITNITNNSSAVVSAAYHGYAIGNKVYIDGVEGGMGALLNGRAWTIIAVIDDHSFAIDADTFGVAAFTSADGGITRTVAADPDPTPPAVPDPVEPPTPPDVYGGAGGDWGRYSFQVPYP